MNDAKPNATLAPAAHRQTRYQAASPLSEAEPLPLPGLTSNIEQAMNDLSEHGLCLVADALSADEIHVLTNRLEQQAAAERALEDLAPPSALGTKQLLSNLVNKGSEFLSLVERPIVDDPAGYLLGKDFLLSSLTAGLFHGPTTEPQPLHRDQGQVPATADFPAIINLFWLLDDFTPGRGSTVVVPGSHRWPAEHQLKAPDRSVATQITAPAGTLFAFDGRIWHGTGVNTEGHPRRHVATFCCLPWMRQQENWGVSCLQEVLDEASPKLKVRLGLKTYGTLGGVNGTRTNQQVTSLGNSEVVFPDYIIGENGRLHPLARVRRDREQTI